MVENHVTSDDFEDVDDRYLEYPNQGPPFQRVPESAYRKSKAFYFFALGFISLMGLGSLAITGIVIIENPEAEIPDVLISLMSAAVGAVAGLFAKQ